MYRTCRCIGFFIAFVFVAFAGCSDSESPTGVRQGTAVDTTSPMSVTDAVITFTAATGEAVLQWTAPQDDKPDERVSRYEILFSYTRGFDPPDFWKNATPVSDPPDPGDPGTPESYNFGFPTRARDLHMGIRSVDEAGNRSLSGNLATVHVPGYAFSGRCEDVFSRSPVEGLDATISNGPQHHYNTDADGRFTHDEELDGGITYVEIRSGASSDLIHPLDQSFVLDHDSTHRFLTIPVESVEAEWAPNLLGLFKRIVNTFPSGDQSAGPSFVLTKWHERPVPCYIPPYVNDDGVDYRMQATGAALRWMERTGEPLFTFVDSAPDTGIVVVYKSQGEISGIASTKHTRGDDGHPIRDEIRIRDNLNDAHLTYKILLHEFGHTISLGHVNDPSFIMYVIHPLPDDISDDEARVVQLHEALPVRIDLSVYDENSP